MALWRIIGAVAAVVALAAAAFFVSRQPEHPAPVETAAIAPAPPQIAPPPPPPAVAPEPPAVAPELPAVAPAPDSAGVASPPLAAQPALEAAQSAQPAPTPQAGQPPPDAPPPAPPQQLAYAPDNQPLPPARPSDLAPAPPEVLSPLPPRRPGDLRATLTPPDAAPAPTTPVAPGVGAPAPAGDFKKGSPVFIRIFKKEGQLELWLRRSGRYALYKTYAICKYSGGLGPKVKEGDYQAPEGFYSVSTRQLHPKSHYHRAFNVGYPNAYDRSLGRTGGLVMVHGDCKSVGCYAMTDAGIDEIYGFVDAALHNGQRETPVHIFPFRMTDANMAREGATGLAALLGAGAGGKWSDFWRNLKQGYDLFEKTHEPPVAYACGGRYAFGAAGASCTRIAGW
ncbi:MAG: hypothetical protein KGL46_05430 [Hyphomicrobiales bacterium]|nr:hypothetical protein [Hyphomicrobiales bacterium]